MVSLAKKLEDKPFHLVASHCQATPKNEVLAYIKSKGLSPTTPNVTVTSQGRHPQVKGNGYVPYYAVFNHHGDLVHHHMCGDYHGGDGLKMVEIVETLLKDAPAIYIGRDKFKAVPNLATQVRAGKKLGGAWAQIEERLVQVMEAGEKSELERLRAALLKHRDGILASANRLLSVDPGAVLPRLNALVKSLKQTTLAQPVLKRIAVLKSSADLKTAIAVAKALATSKKSIEKLKPCKTCRRNGLKSHQDSCLSCRSSNKKSIAKQVARMKKLLAANEKLPIAEAVRAFLKSHE
ncbi:MAG: hypothetical protein ACI97A_002379 [Planctomycetota bacterium]